MVCLSFKLKYFLVINSKIKKVTSYNYIYVCFAIEKKKKKQFCFIKRNTMLILILGF